MEQLDLVPLEPHETGEASTLVNANGSTFPTEGRR